MPKLFRANSVNSCPKVNLILNKEISMRDDLSFAQKLSTQITAAAARQIVIRKREDKRNKIQEQVSQIIQKLIEGGFFHH